MTTPVREADASDDVLLRRIAEGDGEALATLYDRYCRPAFALARRITGESEVAQDVVHEGFLAVWREPARYADLPARLLATVHRLSVQALRRNGTEGAAEPVGEPGPRGHRIGQALGALPPHHRQALVLAYYSGCTQRQIAERTDTTVGTVQARMVAGMHELRTLLHGFSDAGGSRL